MRSSAPPGQTKGASQPSPAQLASRQHEKTYIQEKNTCAQSEKGVRWSICTKRGKKKMRLITILVLYKNFIAGEGERSGYFHALGAHHSDSASFVLVAFTSTAAFCSLHLHCSGCEGELALHLQNAFSRFRGACLPLFILVASLLLQRSFTG